MYKTVTLAVLLLVSLGHSIDITVNRSIRVEDGERKSGSLTTVNGSIYVGKEARVTGTCRSVNGKIRIGESSRVKRLQTVNGGVEVAEDAYVGSDIESVNGPISCGRGVYVRGSVESVNGPIELERTTVHKDITTYNGTITLEDRSVVERDIIIKENKGSTNRRKPLDIYLRDRSVVEGDIIVKQDDFEVIVHLEGGRVEGKIIGATIERD